jgi:hypothetical protein
MCELYKRQVHCRGPRLSYGSLSRGPRASTAHPLADPVHVGAQPRGTERELGAALPVILSPITRALSTRGSSTRPPAGGTANATITCGPTPRTPAARRKRWVHPEQAAAGVLDDIPLDLWPQQAAHWLAAGFDSQPLRQLAALRPEETNAALDLMPEALRSIGFDPAIADEEFVARCQAALDVVQQDLNVTTNGQYRVQAVRPRGWPVAVFAALPDGSYWTGAWGMTRRMDNASLLFHAAGSVSGTIEEVHEIEWPLCAVHGEDPTSAICMATSPSSSSTELCGGGVLARGMRSPQWASSPTKSPQRYDHSVRPERQQLDRNRSFTPA